MPKKEKRFWIIEGVTREEVIKSQADTKFNFLRSCIARRVLISIYVIVSILVAASPSIPGLLGNLICAIGGILLLIGYLLLRTSVRHVADSPDELLDERQIALRDRSYLHAYRWLAGVLSFVSLVFFVRVDLMEEKLVIERWFGFGTWYAALMLMATLPSAVVAWVDESEIDI